VSHHAAAAADEGLDEEEEVEAGGEEQEEEEQEEPEQLGLGAEPEAPPPPPQAPPPAPAAPRRPRSDKGQSHRRKGSTMGATTEMPRFQSINAVDLMAEVFHRLEQYPGLGAPHEYNVQVYTVADGMDRRQGDRFLGSFSLYTLQGQRHPGELLQDYVTDSYHLRRTDDPATYDIRVVRARGGGGLTRAKLDLGSAQEIHAIRKQQEEARRAVPPSYQAPTGYGAPAYQAPPQPPSFMYPGGGVGAPAPAAAPGEDPTIRDLRADLQYTKGLLDEALRAAREGRAPNIPPQGFAAPPSAPLTEERIVTLVTSTVSKVVPEILRGAGVGAPPPPPAVDPMAKLMQDGLQMAVREIITQSLGAVTSQIKTAVSGIGKPVAAAQTEQPEPPPPPDNPSDRLPFELIETKAKWPDGRPVIYPVDRETGDISGQGALFGNPFIAEKGMEIIKVIAETGKAFAERVKLLDGSTVVSRTPPGAVNGNPVGAGAAPQQQQRAQQQPPPQAAAQPPPPPRPPPSTFPVM
jgi:hypothetical protein